MRTLAQDFRYALRRLRKNPSFTFFAVITLALGIGATAAMYSVVYAVILDPFPYKDVDSLMSIAVKAPGDRYGESYHSTDKYLEIAQRNTTFENVIASTIDDVVWTGTGAPQRLRGNHCSMNTFATMGVAPLLGRGTIADDAKLGAEPVAVLGYKFWIRQFGGDVSVIGRRLRLDDTLRTIIGVMPPRFMWRGADVYVPVVFERGKVVEGVRYVHVLGRLKRGVTVERAAADLTPIMRDLQREFPNDFPQQWSVSLISFRDTFRSDIANALWVLFAAVGLLLLIACVNVSSLLLSRAATRRREMAVRAALGASRLRLIRQLIVESVALALLGAGLGTVAALIALNGIIAVVPRDTIPDEAHIALDLPVLLFTLVVCVGTALLFGLAPAFQLAGDDVAVPLRETGRGTTGSGQKRLRNGLVISQVALSLVLLVGANLMLRSLLVVTAMQFGYQPDHMLVMRIPLAEKRYPDAARRNGFFEQLLPRVQNLPGVVAAGLNGGVHPLGAWHLNVAIPGTTHPDSRVVLANMASDDYPRTVGIRLAAGRLFTAQDMALRAHVAVVNQSFARRYFPGQVPLSRAVELPDLRQELTDDSFQIVGITEDAADDLLSAYAQVIPEIYIPYTLTGRADMVAVRAHVPASALAKMAAAQVYAVDKDQPVTDVDSMATVLAEYVYAQPRFKLLLFAIFAVIGLTLALFGVYGVLANFVAQRTQEIGVRMALGADLSRIVKMILGMGWKLLAPGIVAGLAGSLLSLRLLAQQVVNVSTFDPLSFAAAALLLLVSGSCAALWVALRAARVDPVEALRYE